MVNRYSWGQKDNNGAKGLKKKNKKKNKLILQTSGANLTHETGKEMYWLIHTFYLCHHLLVVHITLVFHIEKNPNPIAS